MLELGPLNGERAHVEHRLEDSLLPDGVLRVRDWASERLDRHHRANHVLGANLDWI